MTILREALRRLAEGDRLLCAIKAEVSRGAAQADPQRLLDLYRDYEREVLGLLAKRTGHDLRNPP